MRERYWFERLASDKKLGAGEIQNTFSTWEEFCESGYQLRLTHSGKKFTSIVFDARDKFRDKIKGDSFSSSFLSFLWAFFFFFSTSPFLSS
jgi:hypothetical protein